MSQVIFGRRIPSSVIERLVLGVRVFLFTIIPFVFAWFFAWTRLWWVAVVVLTVACAVSYLVDVQKLEEV